MAIFRDRGVVLRTMRYGEADRIVTLFAEAQGKQRAIIKGVRKTKSRFGARVEVFSHVDVLLYEGRSDLRIISQAELLDPFARIRDDYDAYTCAQIMCESVDKVAPDGERNVRLMTLLLAGLRSLDDLVDAGNAVPDIMGPAFLLKLLGVTGFGPGLRSCVHCGGTEGLSAFSFAEGGVLCRSCRAGGDVVIAPGTVELLRVMWSTRFGDLAGRGEHTCTATAGAADAMGEAAGLVRRLAEYQLERPLRSLVHG